MRVGLVLVFVVGCNAKQPTRDKAEPARDPWKASTAPSVAVPKWMTDATVLRDTMNAVNAHVVVLKSGANFAEYRHVLDVVQRTPGVVAAEPLTFAECPMVHGRSISPTFSIKGVDPERVGKVLAIAPHMTKGSFALAPHTIVLGDVLARNLGVAINDDISIACSGPPVVFRVAGMFHLDFEGWDDHQAFAPFADVQALTGNGDIALGVEMAVEDAEATESVVKSLKQQLPGYIVQDWREINRETLNVAKRH